MPNQQPIYELAIGKWVAALILEHIDELYTIDDTDQAKSCALELAHKITRGNQSERHIEFALHQAEIELEIEEKQNRLRRAIHFDDKKNNFRRNV